MKKHPEKSWEDLIEDRLSNLEVPPDDTLWTNIDQNIRPERYRYASLAAVLLLLLLGLGWFVLYNPEWETKKGSSRGESTLMESQDREGKALPNQDNNSIEPDVDLLEKSATPSGNTLAEKAEEFSGKQTGGKEEGEEGIYAVDPEGGVTSSFQPYKQVRPLISIEQVKREEGEKKDAESYFTGRSSHPLIAVAIRVPDLTIPQVLELEVPALALTTSPAKEKEIVKPKRLNGSRREVWGAINPMLTYRKVMPNLEDEIRIVEMEDQSPLSLNRIGLQASVGVSYFITDRLALKGGAFYRFTQNKWSYSYLPANPDSVMLTPLEGGAVDVEPFFTQRTQKIESNNSELGFLVGLQYSAGKIYRRNINLEVQAAKDPVMDKLLYYIAFDIDIEKSLGKNFLLYAGPSFIWGLNNSSSSTYETFELKPYSLGLKIGLSYRLINQ